MFISLLSTCIENFSNFHALFDFLSHSVAVAARSGIQRVDPQMIHFGLFFITWGLFLESPGNFSGPKSNIQIEIWRIRARVLASKLLHCVSLTDSFIMLAAKRFKPLQLHVNSNSFTGPLVIGAFEKRVPGAQELVQPPDQYLFSLGSWKKNRFWAFIRKR